MHLSYGAIFKISKGFNPIPWRIKKTRISTGLITYEPFSHHSSNFAVGGWVGGKEEFFNTAFWPRIEAGPKRGDGSGLSSY